MATWGYGATAVRLTPDQKVGSSNLSALKHFSAAASGLSHTTLPGDVASGPLPHFKVRIGVWPAEVGARRPGNRQPAPKMRPERFELPAF